MIFSNLYSPGTRSLVMPPVCYQQTPGNQQGGTGTGGAAGNTAGTAGQPGGTTGGSGGDGSQSGDDPSKDGDGDKEPQKKSPTDEVITAGRLTQVLDARQRKTEAAFKKVEEGNTGLRSEISELKELMQKLSEGTAKPSKDKDGGPKDDPEKVEMRRELDQLKSKIKETESRADKESRLRRDESFHRKVIDALTSAGCMKPEHVYRIIKDDLQFSEDGTRVFATVKSEYGEEDLDVEEFIRRVVSEDTVPELFKGKMRAGAPAGGEGGSTGTFIFTKEELLDNPEAYRKDPEKARAAIERGQVKGLKPRGQY